MSDEFFYYVKFDSDLRYEWNKSAERTCCNALNHDIRNKNISRSNTQRSNNINTDNKVLNNRQKLDETTTTLTQLHF